MASRRNGKFKVMAVRPASPRVARPGPSQPPRPSRWYLRLLAEELYRLRLRNDLLVRA